VKEIQSSDLGSLGCVLRDYLDLIKVTESRYEGNIKLLSLGTLSRLKMKEEMEEKAQATDETLR